MEMEQSKDLTVLLECMHYYESHLSLSIRLNKAGSRGANRSWRGDCCARRARCGAALPPSPSFLTD